MRQAASALLAVALASGTVAVVLAGALLWLCLAPVKAVVEVPLLAVPVVLVWAVVGRLACSSAVPDGLVVAVVGIVVTGPD